MRSRPVPHLAPHKRWIGLVVVVALVLVVAVVVTVLPRGNHAAQGGPALDDPALQADAQGLLAALKRQDANAAGDYGLRLNRACAGIVHAGTPATTRDYQFCLKILQNGTP